MKRKFTSQIYVGPSVDAGFVDHVQKLTDDVASIIDRGLTFGENLRASFYVTYVTPGSAFSINDQKLNLKGVVLVNSGGAIVTSVQSNTGTSGALSITVQCDVAASMTFFLFGE